MDLSESTGADVTSSLPPGWQLLAGSDAWHFRPLPGEGVPPLEVADCGHGVTIVGTRHRAATCLPTGISMASTWNPDLLEEAGVLLGKECRALGVSMLLGPMLNLHRIPLNGRSFETFSEDPVLAGKLGAALVRGIQSTGTGACAKALVANNQQANQHDTNVEVDERALRELYLRQFEIVVAEARPMALMTAYNPLHGVNCAENRWLITEVVKGEWGFKGIVVSDWRAVKTDAVYTSGLDMEMPGPGKFLDPESIRKALDEEKISVDDLRDRSARMLRMVRHLGREAARAPEAGPGPDSVTHHEVARRVAEESIVLLKNEQDLLPLDRTSIGSIAVLGPNAAETRLGGGGSASVTAPYTVSPLQGLQKEFGDAVEIRYAEGCGLLGAMEPVPLRHGKAVFFNQGEIGGTPSDAWEVDKVDFAWGWASPGGKVVRGEYAVHFNGQVVPPRSGTYRLALHGQEGGIRLRVNGAWRIDQWVDRDTEDFEGNYGTRSETIELELTEGEPVEVEVQYGKRAARSAIRLEWEVPGEHGPLEQAVAQASRSDVAVLCLGLSNVFEGGANDRVSMDLPPAQVDLLRRVVAVNPRTVVVLNNGGPVVMPWEPEVPVILEAWYAGQEGGNALARILSGAVNPSGKLPDTIPHRIEDHAAAINYPGDGKNVTYEEGLMVGYRHFDHAGIRPHFPFGHGLSYTSFEIKAPEFAGAPATGGRLRLMVTNTGDRDGAEVVQVYVCDPEASVLRPPRELKAFQKVWLAAGETRLLELDLSPRDFMFWHPATRQWTLEPGTFHLVVGPHTLTVEA